MKLNHLHLAALAALSLAPAASAQTTVVDITGATAFRTAAVNAIKNSFTAGVQYGFVGTSFTGSGQHIFKGSFPGIAGTTIVRTSWSGSTEGARSCIFNTASNYLATSVSVTTAGTPSLTAGTTPSSDHDIYFSDVSFTKTQYNNFDFTGQAEELEVLLLQEERVGVIVFCPIKNEMALANPAIANYNRFTNITALQFRSLFSAFNSGRSRLSFFTGDSADDSLTVFATGRNDLSGTRTSYMLESGYGVNNAVNQWKMFSTTNTNVITTIQNWPTGDNAVVNNDNRSVQFTNADTSLPGWTNQNAANEVAGNGGYFSGSALRDALDDTAESVIVKDAAGNNLYLGVPQNVILVSYVGNGDATTAITNGAKALTWNGVGITPANPLSAADKAKITRGDYTAWNFENIVLTGGADADETIVYDAVKAAVPANIGTAGLTMTEMAVRGLTRAQDGGVINISIP